MKGDLLHTHGLKRTPIREEILHLFMSHDHALSASDVLAKLKVSNDRVTIYRALASFEKHGILHKAFEDGHGAKYALSNIQGPNEKPISQHAHFVCEECHKTFCLNEVVVPKVEVSNKFFIDRVDYTLRGICKECNPPV